MQTSEIKSEIIRVYHRSESKRGTTEIRTVKYMFDKGRESRLLEKRDMFVDGEGHIRFGKSRGFNGPDFLLILSKQNDILEDLGKGATTKPEEDKAAMDRLRANPVLDPEAPPQDF